MHESCVLGVGHSRQTRYLFSPLAHPLIRGKAYIRLQQQSNWYLSTTSAKITSNLTENHQLKASSTSTYGLLPAPLLAS